MASRSRHSSRSDRDSDSMEALKPLVVLVLFGTILYGAYSVVQKGPSSTGAVATSDAPAFTPPAVDMTASSAPMPAPAPPQPATTGPLAAPAAVSLPAPTSPPFATTASTPPAAVIPAMPATPPASSLPAPTPAATAAVAAGAAVAAINAAEHSATGSSATTYLNAESAPPPVQESVTPPAAAAAERPDRYATLSSTPPVSAGLLTTGTPSNAASPSALQSSAAFASAWSDAHEKLAAGRYAEALAALSIWHDDPSLGLEESQRLEDLLGQLAGTVIYSQQDLLMPPHVVAPHETLPAVATPLGISWQLLGKINGVASPGDLVPGEHLKVLRGPFDAVISISRRRLTLQLGGYYAGNFPVVIGRSFLPRVGSSIPVTDVRRAVGREDQGPGSGAPDASAKPAIVLAEGLVIESAEDTGLVSDASPATSLVVSVRDFSDLVDILGPGSRVLIRQ